MPDAPRLPSRRDRHAPTRALAALAASLLVVNAAFLWWPDVDLGPDLPTDVAPAEQIVMQMIEPTEQPPPPATLPPAPPPPAATEQLPQEVPDERVVAEVLREIDLPAPPAPPRAAAPTAPPRPAPPRPAPPRLAPPQPPGPPAPSPSVPPAADRIVERPDRSPSVRGQALPVYPASASRSGFRGRARVRVLVNAGGRVTDAEIVTRTVFDRDRETEAVSFPSEFDRAVLDAARRYVFSPARDDGERVRAYAFVTISLDPPD